MASSPKKSHSSQFFCCSPPAYACTAASIPMLFFLVVFSLSNDSLRRTESYGEARSVASFEEKVDHESLVRPPMFQDVSHLIVDNSPDLRYGVCALDADSDGHMEFFVCGFGNPNLVLKWKNGRLENIAMGERFLLADTGRHAIGVAAGDADGDGIEEIYVLNTDTFMGKKRFGDRLFHLGVDKAGLESWTDLFDLPQNIDAANQCAGRSVCTIDRQGSGKYGFFVANYGCPMKFYEISSPNESREEDFRMVDVAEEAGVVRAPTGGRSCLTGPIVSRTAGDIFVGNENGPNFLFVNQGNGLYEEKAGRFGVEDRYEHARGAALTDVRGTAQLGLAIGNWEGPHRLFAAASADLLSDNVGDVQVASFVANETLELSVPSRIRTVIAADFDNDGLDELFYNNIGEPNRLFCQGLPGEWSPCDIGDALESDGYGTGASIADIDSDGRLELLLSHGESVPQPLSLYKGPLNGNSWLRVRPLTAMGAPARGAVVEIFRDGIRRQRRVIDGGSGYLCCMEPVAHFGLGQAQGIEHVEVSVTWPDGQTATVRSAINRELTLQHPSKSN